MTWTLLFSLLVKSSLVAGAGLAASRFLAWRAVERVDILRATVCLLLALPVIMNALPPIELALLPPLPVEPAPVLPATSPTTALAVPATPSPGAIVGGLWLLGAGLIGGRLALGVRTLHRWTRKARPVTHEAWLAPIRHLPAIDRPGLAVSDRVAGPLSWGVAPGTILLDPATLAEPHTAPAIMAHELAHLRRHDWIFLVVSRAVLAIFWFNPLVWRLHASLAERTEEAADAAALTTIDRTLYARTLVRLAATPADAFAAPRIALTRSALPMAADAKTLKTRIACIMTDTPERRRPLTMGLTVAALALVATPLAAFALARQVAPVPPVPPAPPAAIASTLLPPAPPAPPAPISEVVPAAPAAPAPPPAPPAPPAEVWDFGLDSRRFLSEQDIKEIAQARAQAEAARLSAEDVRRIAEQARREVEAHRGEIEAAARMAAEQARLSGEDARRIGEQARAVAMKQARVDMAKGADQMRAGARQMREEAARLRDPAYRAKQIADNRARGQTVTDEELKDLSRRLPDQADDLERQADRLAERVREMS